MTVFVSWSVPCGQQDLVYRLTVEMRLGCKENGVRHSKCSTVTVNLHRFTNPVTLPGCLEGGVLLLLLFLFSSLDYLLSSNLPPRLKESDSWFLHIPLHPPYLGL